VTTNKIPRRLAENIPFMLYHTALEYHAHFDREMHSPQLTRSQWVLLGSLYYCNGINQKDLAEVINLGKAAVGKLAKRLEERGWIERERDPADARAWNLRISQQALPAVKGLVELLLIESDYSLKGFSDAEIDRLQSYLSRIRTNLAAEHPPQQWQNIRKKTMKEIQKAGL
jgi:DNA-binding MarR family transcriptional regulator